jgi:hypothetical protein
LRYERGFYDRRFSNIFSGINLVKGDIKMNLGEYVRTEEFPMVEPARVEPIIIPEKMPVRETESTPAGKPEKEKEFGFV